MLTDINLNVINVVLTTAIASIGVGIGIQIGNDIHAIIKNKITKTKK